MADGVPRRTTEPTDLDSLARTIRQLRDEVAQLRRQVPKGGPTAGDMTERPTEPALGQMFYDFSLGMPIWAANQGPPVIWKTAAGLEV